MSARGAGLIHSLHTTSRSGKPKDLGQPRVEQCHIDYARARRPRMGWQALGQQTGVNPENLRLACERFEAMMSIAVSTAAPAVVASPEPRLPCIPAGPAPEPAWKLRPGSTLGNALLAIASGITTNVGLAKRVGVSVSACRDIALKLQTKGVIDGAWTLTPAGEAHVQMLKATR